MKAGPIPRLSERDIAIDQLQNARDSLEMAVDFLRSLGQAADIEEAIDIITSEIHTLMEEGP